MAFSNISAGSLKTMIIVEAPISRDDGAGGEIDDWENVFGGKKIPAKWVKKMTRFDSSIDDSKNDRVYALETAVINTRYTSRISALCRVKRSADDAWWYVIGAPDRSPDGNWLEFTVERRSRGI